IISLLKAHIKEDKLGHAYLFAGPRGTGKTTVARLFSRALNGIQDESMDASNIDIIEIDAASNRGIDEIRDLRDKVSFTPSRLQYKVYIIDEVHMLTKEAFNALLKTIEEPPAHVVFIFATTEPHKVPVTILSRVIRFDFKLASNDELMKKLTYVLSNESVVFEDAALDLIIRHGRGSFRDSESILGKILSNSQKKKLTRTYVEQLLGLIDSEYVTKFIQSLYETSTDKSLQVLYELETKGVDLHVFCSQVLEEVHYSIVTDFAKNDKSKLQKNATIIKELSKAQREMKTAVLPVLPLEVSVISLCEGTSSYPKQTAKPAVKQVERKESSVKEPVQTKKNDTSKKEEGKGVEKKVTKTKRNSNVTVSIESIKSKWGELLESIRQHNHHLRAFLAKAEVIDIDSNEIVLHVPFEFHRKKLDEKASREKIESTMNTIWECDITYVVKVDKNLLDTVEIIEDTSKSNTNKDVVEQIFGI
ncbi:DNA polymerase III subunit gamma/tau, partial [Candidatus Dojkabacteria bacterium]|nr:DNA polymerase III subunit gamma/tau [Candidatus Dojkabacteria bacterium]